MLKNFVSLCKSCLRLTVFQIPEFYAPSIQTSKFEVKKSSILVLDKKEIWNNVSYGHYQVCVLAGMLLYVFYSGRDIYLRILNVLRLIFALLVVFPHHCMA